MTYETPPTMMHTDPPAHTRYRRLVQPGFKPSVVRALEPAIRARARALVDRLEGGETIDVVERLSVPLPLQVISEIMGLPVEDWERFYDWSEAVIPGATDWPVEKRNELQGEMITFLLDLTQKRRSEPTTDVLSELAAAQVDGDQLSEAELAMFLVQLLVAGNETTRNLISGGLVALAENPGQWSRLVGTGSSSPRRWRRCSAGRPRWSPSCGRPRRTPNSRAFPSPKASPSSWSTPRPTATKRSSDQRPGLRRHPSPQSPHRLRLREPLLPGGGPGPPGSPARLRRTPRPLRRCHSGRRRRTLRFLCHRRRPPGRTLIRLSPRLIRGRSGSALGHGGRLTRV